MDGPPRYSIMNYRYNTTNKNHTWYNVGNYSGLPTEKELVFVDSFKKIMEDYPESVCSDPCSLGQVGNN